MIPRVVGVCVAIIVSLVAVSWTIQASQSRRPSVTFQMNGDLRHEPDEHAEKNEHHDAMNAAHQW
jgi:hypothetical protein